MKTIIFIFLFFTLQLKGQILKFPIKNAYWVVDYSSAGIHSYYDYYYLPAKYSLNDTAINNTIYRKLYINGANDYVAALREDSVNRAIFVVPEDSINEYTLIDFGKNLSDTIYNIYSSYFSETYKDIFHGRITYIDSVINHGIYIYRYTIEPIWTPATGWVPGGVFSSVLWYESFGGMFGINTNNPFYNVSLDLRLICYSEDDTIRFVDEFSLSQIGIAGNCTSILSTPNFEGNYKAFKYNSIVESEIFKIEANGLSGKIKLYDLTGKLLLVNSFEDNIELRLSKLYAGIYFVQLELNNKSFAFKILKY